MADESASGRSHFLSKSKWGKVFKEDQSADPAAVGFKLNEDVVDFLKPSTEKRQLLAPKIDVAIAQRWPAAHEVRRASEATSPPIPIQNRPKPKKKKNLTVSFAKTPPEVIGEGGDEALAPATEISRQQAIMSRSVSAKNPGAGNEGTVRSDVPVPRRPVRAPNREEALRPQHVKRSQTSHNEFSPAVQQRVAPPPPMDLPPHKPSLTRTPAGLVSPDDHLLEDSDEEDIPVLRPRSSLEMMERQNRQRSDANRPQPQLKLPDDYKSTDEQLSVAHRISDSFWDRSTIDKAVQSRALVSDTTTSGNLRHRNNFIGAQSEAPPRSSSDHLGRLNITKSAPVPVRVFEKAPPPSVFDDHDPYAPNVYPSADTKYTRCRAQNESPRFDSVLSHTPVKPMIDSPSAPTAMTTHDSSQVAPQPEAAVSHGQFKPRNTAPPASISITGPGRSRAFRRNENNTASMAVPHEDSRSRSSSPMPDRFFDSQAAMEKPSSFYSRSNNSSSSANHVRTSPKFDNSRTSSQNGQSPLMGRSPASTSQPPPSPRSSVQNGSTSNSPRFSGLIRPTPSPYAREPNPTDYFGGGAARAQAAKSPDTNIRQDESVSPASQGSDYAPAPAEHVDVPAPLLRNQSRKLPPASSLQKVDDRPSLRTSPHGPPPADFFAPYRSTKAQPARLEAASVRKEETSRPSSHNINSQLPQASSSPSGHGAARDAALSDFANRVAHMKGVFRLTAEREQPMERCSPESWLRAAMWWFLIGRAALEAKIQSRPRRNGSQTRELLTQAHVDLAKTWWILSDPLMPYHTPEFSTSSEADSQRNMLTSSVVGVERHLTALTKSMQRNAVMPPHASLIQGQNTNIWIDQPKFAPDVAAALSGPAGKSLIIEPGKQRTDPLSMIPFGDTRNNFYYARMFVEVSVNTDDANTDRVVIPCILTVLRSKSDHLNTIVIASQSELVNITITPGHSDSKRLTWNNVSWKANTLGLLIHLPRGFALSVRCQECDFRTLWSMNEYSRKIEHSLHAGEDEKLVHEARLLELQYADSSNPNAFPVDKVRHCIALAFERTYELSTGSGTRKMHRGFRLLLVTDACNKIVSSVSHEVCRTEPLLFEYITDSAANGTTAMVVRMREERRQCRALLVFKDFHGRQELYDLLNGLNVRPDEEIVAKTPIAGLSIEAAFQADGSSHTSSSVLQSFHWQKLGITNAQMDDSIAKTTGTVLSEHLRIVARHNTGCITDRMNLDKGELLLRLPCSGTPAVQVLRQPQQDMTMSIDTRNCSQGTDHALTELLHTVMQQTTIRTFTFTSSTDLHAFQAAITGLTVRYDGLASKFAIVRRMMVVPVYKKWEASKVRLQIVAHGTVVQLLAFMEDFSHADAMCLQLKSMDVFETIKGDAKGKKWGVKLVDAKFSLPRQEKGEVNEQEKVRRRFVNLEGLEYAEEHDDITIGFETEEERDRFAAALPAATTIGRMITLKRRI